jgi:hypothetical protein
MAVNQIQFAQRAQPKKDALDKVLQGLQIAEAAFGIPVKYEQFRSQRADARMKEDEQAGITTDAQIMKAGGYSVPQSGLMPERRGAGLTPTKVRRGDEVVDVFIGNRDADSKFFNDERALKSDYEGHQLTKDTGAILTNAEKALEILKRGRGGGAADIAAIKTFFKTIESQSAVNEGEFATAAKSAGLWEKLANLQGQVQKGDILSPPGRQAMKGTIRDLVDAQLSIQDVLDDRYTEMANERAFKAKNVVTGFWAQDDSPIRPLKKPESVDTKIWDQMSHSSKRKTLRGIAERMRAAAGSRKPNSEDEE